MRIRNNKVNVFLSDDEKFILKRASVFDILKVDQKIN